MEIRLIVYGLSAVLASLGIVRIVATNLPEEKKKENDADSK